MRAHDKRRAWVNRRQQGVAVLNAMLELVRYVYRLVDYPSKLALLITIS